MATISSDADERMRSLLEQLATETGAFVAGSSAGPALETAREVRVVITSEIASLLAATLLLGDSDGDA